MNSSTKNDMVQYRNIGGRLKHKHSKNKACCPVDAVDRILPIVRNYSKKDRTMIYETLEFVLQNVESVMKQGRVLKKKFFKGRKK